MYSLSQTDMCSLYMFMKPNLVYISRFLNTEYEGVSHLIKTRVKF
jgi:hypothetical protein